MTQENLERGNMIMELLEINKSNMKGANYMLSENVVERKSYLKFNGVDEPIIIPESLFRTIGKLIQAEMIKEHQDLTKEFESM